MYSSLSIMLEAMGLDHDKTMSLLTAFDGWMTGAAVLSAYAREWGTPNAFERKTARSLRLFFPTATNRPGALAAAVFVFFDRQGFEAMNPSLNSAGLSQEFRKDDKSVFVYFYEPDRSRTEAIRAAYEIDPFIYDIVCVPARPGDHPLKTYHHVSSTDEWETLGKELKNCSKESLDRLMGFRHGVVQLDDVPHEDVVSRQGQYERVRLLADFGYVVYVRAEPQQ